MTTLSLGSENIGSDNDHCIHFPGTLTPLHWSKCRGMVTKDGNQIFWNGHLRWQCTLSEARVLDPNCHLWHSSSAARVNSPPPSSPANPNALVVGPSHAPPLPRRVGLHWSDHPLVRQRSD